MAFPVRWASPNPGGLEGGGGKGGREVGSPLPELGRPSSPALGHPRSCFMDLRTQTERQRRSPGPQPAAGRSWARSASMVA